MLDKVKLALRISTDAFDPELLDLIESARDDLYLVGIDPAETRPLIERAIVTYCRVHFGSPDDYERLKRSYDEQKAQLMSCPEYRRRRSCGQVGCPVSEAEELQH